MCFIFYKFNNWFVIFCLCFWRYQHDTYSFINPPIGDKTFYNCYDWQIAKSFRRQTTKRVEDIFGYFSKLFGVFVLFTNSLLPPVFTFYDYLHNSFGRPLINSNDFMPLLLGKIIATMIPFLPAYRFIRSRGPYLKWWQFVIIAIIPFNVLGIGYISIWGSLLWPGVRCKQNS